MNTAKELELQSGITNTLEINGKQLKISPLRVREIIALNQYEEDHTSMEIRAYSMFLHLRENDDIALDFVLDLEMSEANKLAEGIERLLYPSQEKTEVGNL